MKKINRKTFLKERLECNNNLPKDLLKAKYDKMKVSNFTFYRGTDDIYQYDFKLNDLLDKKYFDKDHNVMLQADLHACNFGAFNTNTGDVVYNVNDFDECVISDCQYDLYRMATSLLLVAESNKINEKYFEKIVKTFIESYLREVKRLKTGKLIKEFTSKNTVNPLKYFLNKIDIDNKKARKKLVNKQTKDGKFNYELEKIKKIDDSLKEKIKTSLLDQYIKTVNCKVKTFKVLDIAERLYAGTGSLGVKRIYVYATINGTEVILDVKKQSKPAPQKYLSKEELKINKFKNDAERTIIAYKKFINNCDNYLGYVCLPKIDNEDSGYYSIREIAIEKNTYPLSPIDNKDNDKKLNLSDLKNYYNLIKQYGTILANAHLNTINKDKKVINNIVDDLYNKKYINYFYNIVYKYYNQVNEDYNYFLEIIN